LGRACSTPPTPAPRPKAPYGAKRCSWPALKHYFVRARRQVTAPTRVLVQAGINHPLISSLLGVQCRTRPRFKWIFGCDKEIYLGNTNTRGEIRSTPATTASGQRNPPTMPGTLEVWLQPPNSHAPTHLRASEPRSKAKFGLASTPRAPHHLQLLGFITCRLQGLVTDRACQTEEKWTSREGTQSNHREGRTKRVKMASVPAWAFVWHPRRSLLRHLRRRSLQCYLTMSFSGQNGTGVMHAICLHAAGQKQRLTWPDSWGGAELKPTATSMTLAECRQGCLWRS
jgi:hypothetical protein